MPGEERKILEAATASKTGVVLLHHSPVRCSISFGGRDRGWTVKLSEYTKYLNMLERLESTGYLRFVDAEISEHSWHSYCITQEGRDYITDQPRAS